MKTKSMILGLMLLSSSAFAERIENVKYCETHADKERVEYFLNRDESSEVVKKAILAAMPSLRTRFITFDIEYKGVVRSDSQTVAGTFTSNEEFYNKTMSLLQAEVGSDLSVLDNAKGTTAQRVKNLVKDIGFPKQLGISYGYYPGYHILKENQFSVEGNTLNFTYESGVFSKKNKTIALDQIGELVPTGNKSVWGNDSCADLRVAKEKLEIEHIRGETTYVQTVLGCTTPVICKYIEKKTEAGHMELSLK
jgi:hypothetical protein